MSARLESSQRSATAVAPRPASAADHGRPYTVHRPIVRHIPGRPPRRLASPSARARASRSWPHLMVAAAGALALVLAAPDAAPAQTVNVPNAGPNAGAGLPGTIVTRQPAQAIAPPGSLQDVGLLAAQVAGFARARPVIDPRLVVPRCPAPALSWARADVVRADCADPAWTLYIPVAGAGLAGLGPRLVEKPAIRRGDRVVVESIGAGFAISMEMEAVRDADGSRIALKSPGGRQLLGRIEADGRVVLAR